MSFQFKDSRTASSILGAIMPEQATAPSRRAKVKLARKGRSVALLIDAMDITGMRAAVNSYLRWLILAERVTQVAGDG